MQEDTEQISAASRGFHKSKDEALSAIVDIRSPYGIIISLLICPIGSEYDVPYHMRVAIDLKINVAKWYNVKSNGANVSITERPV